LTKLAPFQLIRRLWGSLHHRLRGRRRSAGSKPPDADGGPCGAPLGAVALVLLLAAADAGAALSVTPPARAQDLPPAAVSTAP
jgi:hypothetical protein